MHVLSRRPRFWGAIVAAAVAVACVLLLGPLTPDSMADPPSALSACPFWSSDVAPDRTPSPGAPAQQTAPAVDFSGRPAAPTLTGELTSGAVTITVGPVPNAVAYRVWRDGVSVGYITAQGQTGPLTVTDTSPCQGAYYDVVAMYDTSGSDASLSRLSQPYWIGSDGSLQPGPGDVPVGTQISMMVTSYNDVGQTASGVDSQLGVCATDPRVIPWGTYFTVPGYGTCYAGDIGTWIQNDTVDVWLPGSQADAWGVQTQTITVTADASGGGSGGSGGAAPAAVPGSSPPASSATPSPASASPPAAAPGSVPSLATPDASPSAAASGSAPSACAPDPSAWYEVQNTNSGDCVQPSGGGTSDGAALVQQPCTASPSQLWQFQSNGNSTFTVVNKAATAEVWDVTGGVGAIGDGTVIELWSSTGALNQQWAAIQQPDGDFEFAAQNSSTECLDVTNVSTSPGTQLQQWACSSTDPAQSFALLSS
jgi:3D (Asp-Asp-Asp) domain-containing protein